MDSQVYREPAVAGQFYPREPERLRSVVREYMEASKVEAAPEQVEAIVVPHAGYMYSGPTAGFAYARICGKKPARVVLLGASHFELIPTASVVTRGAFVTPLGAFPIDEPFAEDLAKMTQSGPVGPHDPEHSLEVQLPFLAEAAGIVPIVPVLFGGASPEWHASVGETLAEIMGDSDLVIASTDLSHRLNEEEANRIDHRTVEAVLSRDWGSLARGLATRRCSMCGGPAVIAAMSYSSARHADSWTLLDYRTSAHASGNYGSVVGYAAISMERTQ